MSILNIEVGKENKILRTLSKEVADIKNPEIQGLISDMQTTLRATKNGIALAAPQVGKNVRIFVVLNEFDLNQTVFINPQILQISADEKLLDEGCLSLPDISGKILRATSLKIQAQNQNGRVFKVKVSGLAAQIFQHEIDHLDGVLFIDKAEKIINI